jgi:hypothetical protein
MAVYYYRFASRPAPGSGMASGLPPEENMEQQTRPPQCGGAPPTVALLATEGFA